LFGLFVIIPNNIMRDKKHRISSYKS